MLVDSFSQHLLGELELFGNTHLLSKYKVN